MNTPSVRPVSYTHLDVYKRQHQSRELLEKCRIAGAQGHALGTGHLEKLLQGGLCIAALAAGLRDDDRVSRLLRLSARLRACAVLRGGGTLLEQVRLAGFEVSECLLDILGLILALAQCSSCLLYTSTQQRLKQQAERSQQMI